MSAGLWENCRLLGWFISATALLIVGSSWPPEGHKGAYIRAVEGEGGLRGPAAWLV